MRRNLLLENCFYSPAKVNLCLYIRRKLDSGYHDLSSIFQAVDLFDKLFIRKSSIDAFTSTSDQVCSNDNTVLKALSLFRERTGIYSCVDIHLEKNIYVAAGLGGGSSNAATLLFALNQIFEAGIGDDILKSWSSEIGADVPFFFSCGSAIVSGIGDVVKDIDHNKINYISSMLLIPAEISMSTQTVFRRLKEIPLNQPSDAEILNSFYEKRPVFENHLEAVTRQICPAFESRKNAIKQVSQDDSITSFMTGSGLTMVVITENQNSIDRILHAFPGSYLARKSLRCSDGWYLPNT